MRILWRRPLFCCCVFGILMALLAFSLLQTLRPFLWALFALPIPFIVIFFRRDLRRGFLPILCCFMSCLMLLSSHLYFDASYAFAEDLAGQEVCISGYVSDRRNDSESYLVTVTELDGKRTRLKAALDCSFSSGLQVGDAITANVCAAEIEKTDSYDEELELLSEGVKVLFLCNEEEDLEVSKLQGFHPILFFRKLNLTLTARLRLSVGGEAGDVASALLLGNKSGLSGDTTLAFRRAGVSHLLALSGLHVSILVGALELLLRKILASRRVRMLLTSLCMIFYLALTGFHASTVRAVLLVLSVYLAFLLWEEPDPITSLGTILYLTLLFVPYSLCDLSLWMSYLATFGILIFAPLTVKIFERLRERLPKLLAKALGWLLGLLLTGCAANGALLLLMSCVFGEVSLASIPVTILLSLPTIFTLVSSIIALIFPALGFFPRIFAGWMIDLSTVVSDRPNVLLSMEKPFLIVLLILFTLLILLLAVLFIKRPIVFLSIPLAMILIFGVAFVFAKTNSAQSVAEDYTFEIQQGDVTVLAENSTDSGAAYALRQELRSVGATKIDRLRFSGYSTKQPYYLSKLATSVRVFTLCLPQPKTDAELAMARRLEQEAALHRIYVIYDAP